MRKLFLITLVILLTGGLAFAQPGYRQDPGVGDILGQGKLQSDPHRIFRMVRYPQATGAALVAESIVVWDVTNDDGVTVTTTTTSGDSAVAGIIKTQALTQDTTGNTAVQDRGKDNWTWLQTYGFAEVRVDGSHGVAEAGAAMGTCATAGEACTFRANTNETTQNGYAGFFYDTSAAAADNVEVFLKGLD